LEEVLPAAQSAMEEVFGGCTGTTAAAEDCRGMGKAFIICDEVSMT
jgi:hypothetical protein